MKLRMPDWAKRLLEWLAYRYGEFTDGDTYEYSELRWRNYALVAGANNIDGKYPVPDWYLSIIRYQDKDVFIIREWDVNRLHPSE